MHIKKCLFFLFFFNLVCAPSWGKTASSRIAATKKAIVTIACKASLSAYTARSAWSGIGCVLDKKKGYILTTKQVTGTAVVGTYHVTFYDGSRAEAHVVYYDPWLDIGFLQVDPTEIPAQVTTLSLSTQDPVMQQPVWVLDYAEDNGISVHSGQVTTLYTITGPLSGHTIGFNTGGSGGTRSLVLNEQGNIITWCSEQGVGLHPAYIRYAWQALAQDQIPVRKHIGVTTRLYSLADAVLYRNFPKEEYQAYSFPGGQVIQVVDLLPHAPAAGTLQTGDLIWAINGQKIGPSLVDFDTILNTTAAPCVFLTICREGQFQEVALALYDLEATKINQLLRFGGVVFFASDDYVSSQLGCPPQSLLFWQEHARAYTIFERVQYGVFGTARIPHVVAMDEKPVSTMADLIACIPYLVKKKYFTMNYIGLLPFHPVHAHPGCRYSVVHRLYKADVGYEDTVPEPRLFTFDPATKTWQAESIQLA